VEKKRRLSDLLKEKRIALISHAVTKGLNPNARMKPSGVEWLGEIPDHWRAVRVVRVAKLETGHTPDKKVVEYWTNCDIPWVSLNDTQSLAEKEYISDTANYVNSAGIANSSARLLPPRAVVFSRDATIGRCAITTRAMAVSQHFIAWLCGSDVLPEYLLYVFRSMTEELNRLTFGATVKTIGISDVKKLATPVPPIDEQKRIVDDVRDMLAALDSMLRKVTRAPPA
jgi:type I restriction enzyme S subunit